ncbi:MAG: hypothetical protein U9N03_07155 [Candidatus Caldatribacteriota bacterium]|nr:hypothetical protein [Candidatus Caldatribacteriota bacterium]
MSFPPAFLNILKPQFAFLPAYCTNSFYIINGVMSNEEPSPVLLRWLI